MVEIFCSYSHADEIFRRQLDTHFGAMKREGLITAWYDREIVAGRSINDEVTRVLERAHIILLLVSPDFIASDYCFQREMRRALERHEAEEARVIPVIVRPCDWQRLPFGGLRATPTDGQPISTARDRDEAFLDVARDVRRVVAELASGRTGKAALTRRASAEAPMPRRSSSPTVRIRRKFTDLDREGLLEEAFAATKNLFKHELARLERQASDIKTKLVSRGDTDFSAVVYVDGAKRGSCRIRISDALGHCILYSNSDADTGSTTSFNDSIRVEDDGYELSLRPMGMATFRVGEEPASGAQGTAEYFWKLMTSQLG